MAVWPVLCSARLTVPNPTLPNPKEARQEPKAVDGLAVAMEEPATAAVYFGAQGLVKTC